MKSQRKRFPQSLIQFLMATEVSTVELPPEVTRLARAIHESLHSEDQRKAINLRFSRLRKHNHHFFSAVVLWLGCESAKTLFQKIGGLWAMSELIKVFKNIESGELPSLALGMHINGAPPIWGFTKLECAAAYAQHLIINHSEVPAKAIWNAANDYSVAYNDIKAKIMPELSKEDLALWADHEQKIR